MVTLFARGVNVNGGSMDEWSCCCCEGKGYSPCAFSAHTGRMRLLHGSLEPTALGSRNGDDSVECRCGSLLHDGGFGPCGNGG